MRLFLTMVIVEKSTTGEMNWWSCVENSFTVIGNLVQSSNSLNMKLFLLLFSHITCKNDFADLFMLILCEWFSGVCGLQIKCSWSMADATGNNSFFLILQYFAINCFGCFIYFVTFKVMWLIINFLAI